MTLLLLRMMDMTLTTIPSFRCQNLFRSPLVRKMRKSCSSIELRFIVLTRMPSSGKSEE